MSNPLRFQLPFRILLVIVFFCVLGSAWSHYSRATPLCESAADSLEFVPDPTCDLDDELSQSEQFFLPPEYTPTQAVIVSDYIGMEDADFRFLKQLLQAPVEVWFLSVHEPAFRELQKLLRENYEVSEAELENLQLFPVQTESAWARDWAPLMTRPNNHYQGEALDLKLLDAKYLQERQIDDYVPAQIRQTLFGRVRRQGELKLKKVALPLYMEGGNIMCTRALCFLSEEVLIENNNLTLKRNEMLERKEVEAIFASHLDQKVFFVPYMPHETTRHIDMWAKFLDETTLLIAELDDHAIEQLPANLKAEARDIQAFLNLQAYGRDQKGQYVPHALVNLLKGYAPKVKIVRIPMPLPAIDQDGEVIYRSYTNSLLVNGQALVPRYLQVYGTEEPYPDDAWIPAYEQAVQKAYEQVGYRVHWIEADHLIQDDGAWHCVTMQVPVT